jgi:hypothetical protein
MNGAIVEMNHKSFLTARPSSRKDHLFKENESIRHKIIAVYFDMIWESVDSMEPARVPYDCKYAFLLWISSLGFVTQWSFDRVYVRRRDIFKKNHHSSLVIKWYQLSSLVRCKNDNILFAYSFCFSRKSCLNKCGTQCKWNGLKLIESCKCNNTVKWATRSISAIELIDLKGDLSNITRILTSRLSRGGLPVRIWSSKSWRSVRTFVIQNWIVRYFKGCSPNCACNLFAMSRASVPPFRRNQMITLWSCSI